MGFHNEHGPMAKSERLKGSKFERGINRFRKIERCWKESSKSNAESFRRRMELETDGS